MRARGLAAVGVLVALSALACGGPRTEAEGLWSACQRGDADACAELGELHEEGQGGAELDEDRALELARQACDGDSARGCVSLGWLLSERDRDAPAYAAFLKACNLGHRGGCYMQAVRLSEGKGTIEDIPRARQMLAEICDAPDPLRDACLDLARIHRNQTDPPDIASAIERYALACSERFPGSCNEAAWLTATWPELERRDAARAVEWAERAVELEPISSNLDTLAAAQALAGDFDQAVGTQSRAIELLAEDTSDEVRAGFEARERAYRDGKVWRGRDEGPGWPADPEPPR